MIIDFYRVIIKKLADYKVEYRLYNYIYNF